MTHNGAKMLRCAVRVLWKTFWQVNKWLFVPHLLSLQCLTSQRRTGSVSVQTGRAAKASRRSGHTPPTSREQWAFFFSWITVASSPLPSHWSTMRPYSQKQEAVTNRNYFPSQSEGPPLRWLLFKVPFFDEISASIFVFFVEKHNFFSLDCLDSLPWVSNPKGNVLGLQWLVTMTHRLSSSKRPQPRQLTNLSAAQEDVVFLSSSQYDHHDFKVFLSQRI